MNTQEKIWFAARITARAEASEAIEFALNEMDALGTEIDILGQRLPLPINMTIVGYFADSPPDEEGLRSQISDALRIYGLPADAARAISIEKIENRDWLAEWKKSWRPTETEKFTIAPVWSEIGETPKIIIRIEPSMAFGTGTHETTQLCLKAIEENYRAGETFLDVGTGTGILAIAATKFQDQKAKVKTLGCDTDADSIKIARENAELNKTAGIDFYVGSIDAETPRFDFVCANLTIDVIVPILPLLVEKTKRILVLSGILQEQENEIVEELKKLQISDFKIETLGMWISVLVEKRGRLN